MDAGQGERLHLQQVPRLSNALEPRRFYHRSQMLDLKLQGLLIAPLASGPASVYSVLVIPLF